MIIVKSPSFLPSSSTDIDGALSLSLRASLTTSPWGQPAISDFAQELGRKLVAGGTRIATGLGAGIGDAIFTGALREIMRLKSGIEESLLLRPFPQAGSPDQLDSTWEAYRREIISHAGICLFLFGNKEVDGSIALADGVLREFEIAREQHAVVVPIGATGSAAQHLATKLLDDPKGFIPELGDDGLKLIGALAATTNDLNSLVDPIVNLVRRIQAGS
jgi:Sir2- and TIR-associating SLOG family